MNVSKISPPAHYGTVKRTLFKLGVKAYIDQNPHSFKRNIYDSLSDIAGSAAWLVNPWYNFGGIRYEVVAAIERQLGVEPAVVASEILPPLVLKSFFRLKAGCANHDLTMLGHALRHLDFYTDGVIIRKITRWVVNMSLIIGGIHALQAYSREGGSAKTIALTAGILVLARYHIHLCLGHWTAEQTLLKYLDGYGRDTLIDELPTFEVKQSTSDVIQIYYFDNQPDDEELLSAIDRMKIKAASNEE